MLLCVHNSSLIEFIWSDGEAILKYHRSDAFSLYIFIILWEDKLKLPNAKLLKVTHCAVDKLWSGSTCCVSIRQCPSLVISSTHLMWSLPCCCIDCGMYSADAADTFFTHTIATVKRFCFGNRRSGRKWMHLMMVRLVMQLMLCRCARASCGTERQRRQHAQRTQGHAVSVEAKHICWICGKSVKE